MFFFLVFFYLRLCCLGVFYANCGHTEIIHCKGGESKQKVLHFLRMLSEPPESITSGFTSRDKKEKKKKNDKAVTL